MTDLAHQISTHQNLARQIIVVLKLNNGHMNFKDFLQIFPNITPEDLVKLNQANLTRTNGVLNIARDNETYIFYPNANKDGTIWLSPI